MIFPWFIIFTRNKLILSKNSPSAIPRSPKSHLPWYLRNRFLQNTRRSWWVYCWMHRKLAHWGNTIICSQLCSKVQEESANYSGSFRISETPSYPARNLREISRVQNDIKPVLLCFPPYLAFFFVFFPRLPTTFWVRALQFIFMRSQDSDRNAAQDPVGVEIVVYCLENNKQRSTGWGAELVFLLCQRNAMLSPLFKISHFPLSWSAPDGTLSVFAEGSWGGGWDWVWQVSYQAKDRA